MPNIDLDVVANTSYAFLLASYIMRDILWLRVLTVISLGFEVPYFYFQPDPLWDGIGWDAAFILINVYWIGRLAYERRPVNLTADQKRVWETALHRLQPRHARKLFKLAEIKSVAAKETIATRGETLHELSLITEGKAELRLNQQKIEELGPGHFIGSASFLERNQDFPQFGTIVAVEPTRMMTWNKDQLAKLVERDNLLSMAIGATLGLNAANLLYRAWERETLKE